MIEFGLCCIFKKEPIKFKKLKLNYLKKINRFEQLNLISDIVLFNSISLLKALIYCKTHTIKAFRITSDFFPLKTHERIKYKISELKYNKKILELLKYCGEFARNNKIRTTFHPGPFTILSSPNKKVVKSSLDTLKYLAKLSKLVNADIINIHVGGHYGNKKNAISRFLKNYNSLDKNIKKLLTIENDDKIYGFDDVLNIHKIAKIPICFDIHHHRVFNKNNTSLNEAFDVAKKTWKRKPLFHISSSRGLLTRKELLAHNDFIKISDFSLNWIKSNLTLEIEAKSKEIAVNKLFKDIKKQFGYKLN